MLFTLGAFGCTAENDPVKLTSSNESLDDEESAYELMTDEIESENYTSDSPDPDLETDQLSEEIDSIIVGTQVGDRIPEFKVIYEDGTEVTSASLIENGKPVFMFFAATWCPGCARELAELKEVYPEFTDVIVFIYTNNEGPTVIIDI